MRRRLRGKQSPGPVACEGQFFKVVDFLGEPLGLNAALMAMVMLFLVFLNYLH